MTTVAPAPWAGRGRCAIAGIGATEFSRRSGRSELALAAEASLAALEDAGIAPAEVDGVVRCDMDLVTPADLARTLGLRDLTYWGSNGPGGTAPCAMVGQAIGAVLSGQAGTVLVFRALNGRSGRRVGGPLAGADAGDGAGPPVVVGGGGSYDEFFAPYGLVSPVQNYALIARRHMVELGTTQEQLGHVALACRRRARANPAAQMRAPLDMETYLGSRPVADPLRLYDCCLETDGACALVVTSVERARDGQAPPAVVAGVAQGAGPDVQGGLLFPTLLCDSVTSTASRHVAATLYRRAGLGPADVEVAQLYDCFTITVLLQLADYGFCEPGDAGPFAAGGALDLDGRLPLNTSGGHLSEGYLHGMNHVLEGVRQVRGSSTSQVPGAAVCLVTSGAPTPTSALVLTAAA